MRSPVSYAVLGLVIEQPSYGYELLQRLRSRYGELLEVSSPSHVYAALDRLQREGLIAHAADARPPDEDATSRRPKVTYRATAAGADAYQEWLVERLRDDERRVELTGRLVAAAAHSRGALDALIDRYERTWADEAQRTSPRDGMEADGEQALVERLVAAERRFALDAQRRWIEFARAELRAWDGGG